MPIPYSIHYHIINILDKRNKKQIPSFILWLWEFSDDRITNEASMPAYQHQSLQSKHTITTQDDEIVTR